MSVICVCVCVFVCSDHDIFRMGYGYLSLQYIYVFKQSIFGQSLVTKSYSVQVKFVQKSGSPQGQCGIKVKLNLVLPFKAVL